MSNTKSGIGKEPASVVEIVAGTIRPKDIVSISAQSQECVRYTIPAQHLAGFSP